VPATRTFALNLKAGACTLPLSKLAQLRFRLLKPVGHAHFAIHRHRCGEVFLSLPAIARVATERAKAADAEGWYDAPRSQRRNLLPQFAEQRLGVLQIGR
jgi:hypothetical protein